MFAAHIGRKPPTYGAIISVACGVDDDAVYCVAWSGYYSFLLGFRYECPSSREPDLQFIANNLYTDIEEPHYGRLAEFPVVTDGIGWLGDVDSDIRIPPLARVYPA